MRALGQVGHFRVDHMLTTGLLFSIDMLRVISNEVRKAMYIVVIVRVV